MVIDNNSYIKNQISNINSNNTAQVQKQQLQQEQSATNAAITAVPVQNQKLDKLEISETAKNYNQIFDKVKSGEYNKPETINAVARKLSKLI